MKLFSTIDKLISSAIITVQLASVRAEPVVQLGGASKTPN